MNKGVFVISIDYEYAWGYRDQTLSPEWEKRINGETKITKRLLDLFEKYQISATWAIVGHLLDTYGTDGSAPFFSS